MHIADIITARDHYRTVDISYVSIRPVISRKSVSMSTSKDLSSSLCSGAR